MTNKRPLKSYIRYDGSGRAVSSSLIWRKNKPKVGNWKEVQGYECCNPSSDCPLLEVQVYYTEESSGICTGQGVLGTYFMDCNPDSFLPSIYLDANGTTPASTGYYSFENTVIANILYVIDGNGQSFTSCPA